MCDVMYEKGKNKKIILRKMSFSGFGDVLPLAIYHSTKAFSVFSVRNQDYNDQLWETWKVWLYNYKRKVNGEKSN